MSLQAHDITITAGGTLLIDELDCTAPAGHLTALVGPNGSGKTSLLRALSAVRTPDAGRIEFESHDLLGMPRRHRAQTVALVEQDATTELQLTVNAVVGLGRLPYQSMWGSTDRESQSIIDGALEAVDLRDFAARDFSTLSGGERQRVMLARALAQQPRLMLLDEPTNHLDIGAQLSVLALLQGLTRRGVTVIAALHDLGLAATYSDHLIVVNFGRVVAAGPTASTLTPALIREVYGVQANVLTNPVTHRPVIALSPLN